VGGDPKLQADLSFLIGTAVILTIGDYALVWIGSG